MTIVIISSSTGLAPDDMQQPITWTNNDYDLGNMTNEVNCSFHIDVSVQERRNSTANILELRLSCTNSLIFNHCDFWPFYKHTISVQNQASCNHFQCIKTLYMTLAENCHTIQLYVYTFHQMESDYPQLLKWILWYSLTNIFHLISFHKYIITSTDVYGI